MGDATTATTRARRAGVAVSATLLGAVSLAACGVHITKNGISGDIGGHHFSAAVHSLPAGLPSDVPLPDNSRVLGGGSAGDSAGSGFDAAFAVTGSVATGSANYQAKFRSAGYTVSNVQSPTSTAVTGSPSNSSSTTVTLTGATFTAKSGTWVVEVEMGASSSTSGAGLKPGEFGVNITVVSTSLTTTTG